jgi:signal transduction histidine kinase/ligand-binding sensor domain-containing protein
MERMYLFLAYLFWGAGVAAQQYPFVQYTPKDGLVNSRVRKVCQDSKGRMYFITYGGLSIYDGTRFINYTRQEGLPNDVVNDILEINADTLLIATNTNKLNTLVHGRIGFYPVAGNTYPLINRFLKSSDGQIYAAADDGLFVLTGNKFTRLPVNDKQGKDMGLYFDKIIEWKNYFLITPWDERLERLILYDKKKRITRDIYTSAVVSGMTADREGNVWLSTSTGIKQLDKDSLQNGRLSVKKLPDIYSYASHNKGAVFFDKAGNLWTYTGNSIRIISPKKTEQIISPEHGLKTSFLLDLFEDREGIMWIATDGNGVIKMSGSNIQLLNSFTPNHPLWVSAIQQLQDTLWLYNAADKTICRMYNNQLERFPFKSGNIYTQGPNLYVVNEKEILCVTNKNEPASYKRPEIIFNNLPKGIRLGYGAADRYGAIIVLKQRNDSAYNISVYKDSKLLMEHPISFMADKIMLDGQQRLWVVTRDDHLMVFTLHPEEPARYLQLQQDYSKQLPFMGPRTFTIDNDGNVWIGTRYNGVFKIELLGGKALSIKQFTTHDGLTDNFIYSMACDTNNNVWAGTQSGLDKIFLKDGHYIISNVSKNNNFFQAIHQIAITKDNTVWATSNEGSILKITQAPSIVPPAPPPLLLNLSEVNSNSFEGSENSFSYKQNNFSFNVAATSFFDEKSILYSYQLSGSGNDNWSSPSHNSVFNFSNLSPGRYTLNARSQFPEDLYSPQTASYTFTILPPWWQTVLFRLLAAALIIVLLILVTRLYYRRKFEQQRVILEKKQAIEKERTRIATDMHDDLGAGLSRIKFLSETIGIKKQQQQPIEEDISKIREYSHEMIDKMGEIVWALNEKNDSLSDLLSYTRSYAAEYLSQNGIACTVSLPEQLSSAFVSGEFRRNIFLAVKEILHNVVKHSQANHVNIEMNADHGLLIRIEDDGIGFDLTHIRPFSNGLPNIEKRMKDIGGAVEIQSAKGTSVKLKIPLSL